MPGGWLSPVGPSSWRPSQESRYRRRMQSKYRPDIDGLRAVAVVAVVLFHASIPGFSGGYAGVDVFFVISGLLITQIIHREIETSSFSFARFYERRIRRIIPALFAMLIFTSIASLMLLPYDLKQYGKSLAAVPLFLSNFIFWLAAGLFRQLVSSHPACAHLVARHRRAV